MAEGSTAGTASPCTDDEQRERERRQEAVQRTVVSLQNLEESIADATVAAASAAAAVSGSDNDCVDGDDDGAGGGDGDSGDEVALHTSSPLRGASTPAVQPLPLQRTHSDEDQVIFGSPSLSAGSDPSAIGSVTPTTTQQPVVPSKLDPGIGNAITGRARSGTGQVIGTCHSVQLSSEHEEEEEDAAAAVGAAIAREACEAIDSMDEDELREACEHWGFQPVSCVVTEEAMRSQLREHYSAGSGLTAMRGCYDDDFGEEEEEVVERGKEGRAGE